MVDHENVLEKCLPIPHGFKLIKIVNNTMYLMRDEEYEKIELFARRKRNNWDVWGNEVESDVAFP